MSSTPNFELFYFPIRGRAEQIRLLLAYTGTPFTDTGVTDWATFRSKTPLGQLPVLIDRTSGEDWAIPQSIAIMRHIARVAGAYGDNEREHVLADVVAETVQDVRTKFVPVMFAGRFQTPAETIAKYWAEGMQQGLGLLATLLSRSAVPAAGFFAGAKPTYADIMVFDLLDGHLLLKPGCLDGMPSLKAFYERMRSLPTLASYLASRRPSELQPQQ